MVYWGIMDIWQAETSRNPLTHNLKEHYNNHNGLNEANKNKFMNGFINAKKQAGITSLPNVYYFNPGGFQPAKCPLRLKKQKRRTFLRF